MSLTRSGARLSISYGYAPCRLGLCGPSEKNKKEIITQYLKGDIHLESKVKKIIKEFRGAYPYYQIIAKSNKIKNPLDKRVVEAYWLGNSLLKKVKVEDLKKMMIRKFLPLGKVALEKIENISENAIPFHNFHMLRIGSVTGTFKETEAGLDICRVSWGRVKKIKKDKLFVSRQPLKFGKKISLGKNKEVIVSWNKDILLDVKLNDWVSIHWNTAIEKLNAKQLKNIKKYNKIVLK